LILPQESQNQAIDAQRSQVLSLLGKVFDFARPGNVALAAAQHHPNRYGNTLANLPNRFETGREAAEFEISHNFQPSAPPLLCFQSVFEGGHNHFQKAGSGWRTWRFMAHSSPLRTNKKASVARRLFVV
jgi:hypothetical protein